MNPQLIQKLLQATQHLQVNELIAAQTLLEDILSIEQRQPDAIRLLGVIAALRKEWNEALRLIDLALEIDPKNGVAHSNRGNIFNELMRNEEALSCYEMAISLQPNYVEAYSNKGNALQALKRYEEALASYEKAILLDGNCVQAFYGASSIFLLRNRYDFALVCCEQILKIHPNDELALEQKGNILYKIKDYEGAISVCNELLKINPHSSHALLVKGNVYAEIKQFDEASKAFSEVIALNQNPGFLVGTAAQISLQMCDWKNQSIQIKELVNKIEGNEKAAIPYNLISLLDDKHLIRRAIEVYARDMQGGINRVIQGVKERKEKIRLGYFSADFHNHPTAYLIAELFECHDKSKFELIAFVYGRNVPDEMRSRLQNAFDQFIDINDKTDEEAAQLSREMEIDIAIDLKGFTQEGRPQIFMHGAAPIQVSYLAFPGTMGLPCFDYVVADPILIPQEAQDGMVEKIIYMPNSYQVNDRNRAISKNKKTRDDFCLPSAGFIFCCFNNNYKITPSVFNGWARILNAVEGSVLWLFGDNPYAIENLKKEAQARGLDSARLLFAERLDPADHLARYELADLFLDTTPCNAHTTASDALWAGLPVITLVGESFAARVAASLLSAVGVPDLITYTQEEYEQKAISLAKNPHELSAIKDRLLVNRFTTPLFDTPLFTKHIEQGYLMAYERYQAGLLPDHLYIV